MLNTFKYTMLSIVRERDIVIWVILFPLILSTLFNAMFVGLEESGWNIDPLPVAVLDNSQHGEGEAFMTMMKALSADSDADSGTKKGADEALMAPRYVESSQEAYELLQSREVMGVITVDEQGWPRLELSPGADDVGVSIERIERTIVADVVNNFSRTRTAIEDIARTKPELLAQPQFIESTMSPVEYVERVSITHSKAVDYVRYFYALLGFAAFMAAMVGFSAVSKVLPNISALGARRTVGGTSRVRMLTGAVLASWLISFIALLVAFLYIRFVLGIDFGGRELACVGGLAVAALMSTSFGALVGALPKIPLSAKGGILTGITCLLSLFAGLYGTPSMQLADQVARNLPWLSMLNPVKQVTDLFYGLYVYSDYGPYFQGLGLLLASTAVFSCVSALLMRRQSYASL